MGHDDCVTALLEHKASALCRDTQGSTPLHYAASGGHTEILASLVQAAMATDPQDKLLDNKQYTPLHWAAYKGPGSFKAKNLHQIAVFVVTNEDCGDSSPQGMKTVWRFYLNSKHLSTKMETLSPPCTVLCQYQPRIFLLFIYFCLPSPGILNFLF